MLSRRQLRIKTLQSLYSYFQSGKSDPAIAERELFRSIEKAYELYIYLLLLFRELGEADRNDADELHKRFFPNQEELLAKRRLFELRFIVTLGKDAAFKNLCDRYRINWQNQQDLVRKIFLEIKKSQEYRAFLKDETAEEKDFLSGI
ncbi:MAG: hypothetical protein IT242_04965, partial [Bacteroidia bacterium]|nr:hypothetical protein [Bacteroidia bacterium]